VGKQRVLAAFCFLEKRDADAGKRREEKKKQGDYKPDGCATTASGYDR